MNCETIDQNIDLTLQQYRADGVSVKLLAVRSSAASFLLHAAMSVTVGVTMLKAELPSYADVWHYGQAITRITEARPFGLWAIDPSRLIGIHKAATHLPDDSVLSELAVDLYWPVLPAVCEPTYHVQSTHISAVIGAYTGSIYGDWHGRRQRSARVCMLN